MKILLYGNRKTTNNRLGKIETILEKDVSFNLIIGGGGKRIIDRLSDSIKCLRCDLVYVGPFAHVNTKMLKLAKLLKKKVVVDFYASYYDMNILDRQIYLKDSVEGKDSLQRDKKAIEIADYIIFLNNAERDYYLRVVECTQYTNKSRIIPLVIESHPRACLKYYTNHSFPFNIVFCGTYIPLHGIQIILEAIKILYQEGYKFHLYMWGNNDCIDISVKYQDWVKDQGLAKFITFWNDWNKENYYKWCVENCALMLGVFGESEKAYTVVPNKVVDAMAFGIPCVTGESKGAREFFDGENDVVLVRHSPEELATAILKQMHKDYMDIEWQVKLTDEIYKNNFSEHAFEHNIKMLLRELEF